MAIVDPASRGTFLRELRRDPKPQMVLDIFRRVPRRRLFIYLTRLNQQGLLEKLIPAWAKIKGLEAQTSHRNTVDVHSLQVVNHIARNEDLNRVDKPELVLLAGLLHDIGKGIDPERHEKAGAEAIPEILRDTGISGEDVLRVQWLVRHHSFMGGVYTMTSRDANPVIRLHRLAQLAQNPSRLTDLYLLSYADTFDAFQSERAAEAVRNYYRDTYALLTYGLTPTQRTEVVAVKVTPLLAAGDQNKLGAHLEQVTSERYFQEGPRAIAEDVGLRSKLEEGGEAVAWATTEHPYRDCTRILKIAVKGESDTLWKAALALSQKEINIVRANVFYFKDGTWIIKFYVVEPPQPQAVIGDVIGSFKELLADGALAEGVTLPEDNSGPFRKRVELDNNIAAGQTAVMVTTSDRLFLFYQLTRVLARFGRIHQVLATTAEDQVTDIFYITDSAGQPITDVSTLDQIRSELLEAA